MARTGVWVTVLVLTGCVWGCNSVPLTAPLWSEAQRREAAISCLNLGVKALNEGDLDRADQQLELAVLLRDDEGEGVLHVAQRLLEEVKPNNAVPLLEKAIQQQGQGSNPVLYALLTRAYTMLDTQENAQRCQKQAEELVHTAELLLDKPAPAQEADRQERVRLLLGAGRYCGEFAPQLEPERAIALLNGAVWLGSLTPLTPQDARVRSVLGELLARQKGKKERAEAVRLTRQAAQFDPANPMLLHAYGFALLQKGDLAGAQRVLREAVDLSPESAELHLHLGQTYAQEKLFAQAARELDLAVLLRPQLQEAIEARKKLPKPQPAQEDVPEEELF